MIGEYLQSPYICSSFHHTLDHTASSDHIKETINILTRAAENDRLFPKTNTEYQDKLIQLILECSSQLVDGKNVINFVSFYYKFLQALHMKKLFHQKEYQFLFQHENHYLQIDILNSLLLNDTYFILSTINKPNIKQVCHYIFEFMKYLLLIEQQQITSNKLILRAQDLLVKVFEFGSVDTVKYLKVLLNWLLIESKEPPKSQFLQATLRIVAHLLSEYADHQSLMNLRNFLISISSSLSLRKFEIYLTHLEALFTTDLYLQILEELLVRQNNATFRLALLKVVSNTLSSLHSEEFSRTMKTLTDVTMLDPNQLVRLKALQTLLSYSTLQDNDAIEGGHCSEIDKTRVRIVIMKCRDVDESIRGFSMKSLVDAGIKGIRNLLDDSELRSTTKTLLSTLSIPSFCASDEFIAFVKDFVTICLRIVDRTGPENLKLIFSDEFSREVKQLLIASIRTL